MPTIPVSETRTESISQELMEVRGWNLQRPPKGNVLWKNEYRSFPAILEALAGKGKKGAGGDAYPDFLITSKEGRVLMVGEAKSRAADIEAAIIEARHYSDALFEFGINALAVGIAGGDSENIAVSVSKRYGKEWKAIEYRGVPIQWLPTPDEADLLLRDLDVFDLQPRIPSNEVLASRADEINRIFRECKIKDEFRPAVIGAFMLALWNSRGTIRMDTEHVLPDINQECRKAFIKAGKVEISESIMVPEANEKLAANAPRICRILRVLNVTTLTAEHDYLGQLYEAFFRFTGGNTIGQFFTPRHVTRFIVDLCQVSDSDFVVDPTCGTGGFLISSLYRMMGSRHFTNEQISALVATRLKGFESEPVTAALCVANMILRGDGTTGVIKGDCFTDSRYPVGEATIVVGNPPFPHAKTDDPSEKFVDRALEALRTRGRLAMIVPESLMVKATKRGWREGTLKKNTLHGVISFPADLFQPYAAANTCVILLEKGVPHSSDTQTFFCKIENDGYRLKKNTRAERTGEQLSDAATAFKLGTSKDRFCKWAAVGHKEWAPGAYIESGGYSDSDIREDALWLLRSLTAFHALHADRLTELYHELAEGAYKPVPYIDLARKGTRKKDYGGTPGSVGAMFDLYYGQQELEAKTGLYAGPMPVISSAGSDNGCYGFFDFAEIASLIQPPFVTVPRTGSIGEAFVQTFPCGVTSDCILLIPKPGTDMEDLFLAAAAIRRERWRFNYGRKMTPNRLAEILVPRDDVLRAWLAEERRQAQQLMRSALSVLASNTVGSDFREAAERWKDECGHISMLSKAIVHPDYQRIVGMGPQAVPLLLAELQRSPDHWFPALHAITQANPVPTESEGKVAEMVQAWLEWGRTERYID